MWLTFCSIVLKKLLKYVQFKSMSVITLLYYYANADLLVEILVNLFYNLI